MCQNNGNLLAVGGRDKNVKIFDKRGSKIVQSSFDGIHTGIYLDLFNNIILILLIALRLDLLCEMESKW